MLHGVHTCKMRHVKHAHKHTHKLRLNISNHLWQAGCRMDWAFRTQIGLLPNGNTYLLQRHIATEILSSTRSHALHRVAQPVFSDMPETLRSDDIRWQRLILARLNSSLQSFTPYTAHLQSSYACDSIPVLQASDDPG